MSHKASKDKRLQSQVGALSENHGLPNHLPQYTIVCLQDKSEVGGTKKTVRLENLNELWSLATSFIFLSQHLSPKSTTTPNLTSTPLPSLDPTITFQEVCVRKRNPVLLSLPSHSDTKGEITSRARSSGTNKVRRENSPAKSSLRTSSRVRKEDDFISSQVRKQLKTYFPSRSQTRGNS